MVCSSTEQKYVKLPKKKTINKMEKEVALDKRIDYQVGAAHSVASNSDSEDIECGTITYNNKTRILNFICLYCNINYEDVEYFCQHLSQHIDEQHIEDNEEYIDADFNEIAGELYEDEEEIQQENSHSPLTKEGNLEFNKGDSNTDSNVAISDCKDNCQNASELILELNKTALFDDNNEPCYNGSNVQESKKPSPVATNSSFEECFLKEIKIEKIRSQDIVVTENKTSLFDNNEPGYNGSNVQESKKPIHVATNSSFEECFLKEINIEKIRSQGIVVTEPDEPPVKYPHLNLLKAFKPKHSQHPQKKKKKVTTVKVIAVKNRINDIYERIKNEQTKSQQILSSNGYLNRSNSSESVEQLDKQSDYENQPSGDDKRKGTRKVIGETLITLIPEGTKIPNTLPSPVQGATKHLNISVIKKGANEHQQGPVSAAKFQSSSKETKPVCPACGKVFRSHFSLTIHKRVHYLESDSSVKLALACPDCDQLFNKLAQLNQHIESVHFPDGFVCKICNRKLSSLSLLERHMIKVHLDRPFNCVQCGKNFSDPVTYEEHVISHNSHKLHKCHICGRKYSTEFFLTEHMRNHKEQIPKKCVVCGKVTLRITQHMKIHTPRPKRLLSCSVCGKVFNFSSGLSHHFKVMHKYPRSQQKMKKDNPTTSSGPKRKRKGRTHNKNNTANEDDFNIITDSYGDSVQIIEEPSEIPDEVYNDEELTGNVKQSSIEDDNSTHFNAHHHLLDHTTSCSTPSFDPEEVNHKEEEAKRVIVELIQNSSYPSFFPDNLSSVLEVTPPIAAREETISAVNSIVHDLLKISKMLKVLPPTIISNRAKAKCGEIYFHNSTEFTILCVCGLKHFMFDDFLLHIQNVHFENDLLKTESFNSNDNSSTHNLGIQIKSEGGDVATSYDQLHEEEIWDSQGFIGGGEEDFLSANDNINDDDDGESASNSFEEEVLSVLKKKPKAKKTKPPKKIIKSDFEEDNDEEDDHSSDEDFKPELDDDETAANEQSVECEICGKNFRNAKLLKAHTKRAHSESGERKKEATEDKEQICPECKEVFSKRKHLDKHVIEIHGGFKCSMCELRWKQRHQVKRHEKTHNAERNFTCPIEGCGKSFAEKYYLKRHIDVHTTDRSFTCDFENCGKAFHTMRRLRAHQKIHTKPKNLICDACGYTCRENETLRVHQRSHTGEKPYACEVCQKRFVSSSALGEHMASHSTERPHICKVCNASFARQKALYHHSFLHLDIKKFKCKICGSAYKQASGLAGHMRKHREEGMMSMVPERGNVAAGRLSPPAVASSTATTALRVAAYMPPTYPFPKQMYFVLQTNNKNNNKLEKMLKNCFLPVNYNKPFVCGEIYFQKSFDDFIFNCKLCKIKIFEYFDFVKHLRDAHEGELLTTNTKENEPCTSSSSCKIEIFDEVEEIEEYILNSSISSSKNEAYQTIIKDNNEEETFKDDDFYDEDYNPANEDDEREDSVDSDEEENEVKSIMRKPCQPKDFVCEICEKKFASQKRLDLHIKMVHLRERPYKCDYCDKSFLDNNSLQNHIGQHTGYNCPTCNKTFSTKRNLKRHSYLHIETKEFICQAENCGKAFSNKVLLREHARSHKADILICEECGYKCRQRESLIVHKRSHTGEKPFACELCDRRFASKPLLKEHMAAHEPERNHICDVCGKSFNRPKALYHHKHLHLGIKKYVCKICGQAYAQAAGLSAHMRKHREESGIFSSELTNPLNVNVIFNNI
ncbi:uncharacterized protein [Musca autumnalis]|uniref:uncharacterized protein n=1 Tax=Musca autumnalis TaxID=221902 RepID=UPI003CE6B6DF